MERSSWDTFSNARSQSHVAGLVATARDVSADELMPMLEYRREERMIACGGRDPIRIVLAYAQNEWAYDESNKLVRLDKTAYENLPRERRLNKFGLAYRRDAQFYLNKPLADIVVSAAVRLYKTQGWTTVLYDGLRTVEGAFNLYNFATDSDLESGLLALPGQSAHNKGLAVDSMMEDGSGNEIDMGGHLDHLDMQTNARTYNDNGISEVAKKNRIIREAAFLYGAFTQGLLIAPLRNEFWDDRPPEDRTDLWRVLDSAARCLGVTLLSAEDEALRKSNRAAFSAKWENWNYADFLTRWDELVSGRERMAQALFGVTSPPAIERTEFYHGNYHPIYDRDLVKSGKNLTRIGG